MKWTCPHCGTINEDMPIYAPLGVRCDNCGVGFGWNKVILTSPGAPVGEKDQSSRVTNPKSVV